MGEGEEEQAIKFLSKHISGKRGKSSFCSLFCFYFSSFFYLSLDAWFKRLQNAKRKKNLLLKIRLGAFK